MLAYIKYTRNVESDSVGQLSFRGFGSKEFIDVSAIEHCVGFFEVRRKYYIVDKEIANYSYLESDNEEI
jgi:hypothetical protein